MKHTLSILVLAIVIVCAVPLTANENPSYMLYDQSLGGQLGEISGYGLSYQKRFDQVALQGTFGFVFNGSRISYGDLLDYIIGLEYQHTIYGDDFGSWLAGQIYLFGGANHRGYIPRQVDTFAILPYQATVTVGAGIGVEVLFFHHFSIPVELGYALTWTPSSTDPIWEELTVGLVPQVGLRYRF